MAKKETEELDEPTLEDLEDEDIEEIETPPEEGEKEEVETESLEARVETEKKSVEDFDKGAEDLRLATRCLGKIVGKVDVEEILGSIFNDFCIGK